MRKIFSIISLTFLVWTIDSGLWISYADIPHLINYQGKLTDKDDKPISGVRKITFAIYDVNMGGTPLWQEEQDVSVNKGIFSVLLGSNKPISLIFDKPYYLGVQVEGEEEMYPRQRMASVGYAYSAEYGVPKGSIIMWSGKIADIPKGWALCDGTNGTPDLRDRFIVGAKQDDGGTAKTNITGSLAQSGGSTTISIDNLPPHDHGTGGVHSHEISVQNENRGGWSRAMGGDGGGPAGQYSTTSAGTHSHGSVGSGKLYTPPYYALAYIMKL